MFVYVSATRWDRVNGGVGLRNGAIVRARFGNGCDDVELAAAYRLDETFRTGVRRVATMLAIVSARFGVDRARIGRDIR